jgi:uncharacterized membrane protein YphA (DoxX/SURF4 family)
MATSTAVSETSPRPGPLPRTLLVLGRVALGFVFLYAAYAKLHFDGAWHLSDYHFFFAMMIDSYHVLPFWGVQGMAHVLPWFELALGALLVSGLALRWVGAATTALLLVFIGAMVRAKILGLEINCGCFGNNEKLGALTILRDSSLLLLSVAVTIGAFVLEKQKATTRS